MIKENITKAIVSAIGYVENSMKALTAKDEKLLRDMVWHVSAELEYALFFFSILRENKTESPPSLRKSGSSSKQIEVNSVFTTNYELLKEAKKCLDSDELDEAYEKIWQVRGDFHKIEDILEKKRKSGEKSA